jgi:putative inorganic carbon (HCO3(-)) transporter
MSLRDLLLVAIILASIPFAITRPWLAILFWVWVSVVAPQWNVFGFMAGWPLAQTYAIIVLISFILTQEKLRFKLRPEVVCLALLVLCVNLSMLDAANPEEAWRKWGYIMKGMLLVFAAIYALNTRRQVELLAATLAFSIGIFAVKGGIFTLMTGGEHIVQGPNPSWENNGWAIATILVIPLIVYFLRQAQSHWVKWCLAAGIALATFSVFGSFSRGAFLSIAAMFCFLWLKSKKKIVSVVALVPLVAMAVVFMPAKWEERMRTIETYQADDSAQGRINTWITLFNAANDRPLFGLGPYPYTPEVFARYSPNPDIIKSAHSMYFEVLGENGYPALLFFLLTWLFTWTDASWVIRKCKGRPDMQWAASLVAMVQVSLIGHFVGGAFLANAYFEPVYYLLVIVVVVRDIVAKAIAAESARAKPERSAIESADAAPAIEIPAHTNRRW